MRAPLRAESPRLLPVLPSTHSWPSTVLCTVGLGLSLFLAFLKLFSLPCLGPGGCHAVIHSSYGTAVGVPVGVFGALLWSAAILVPDDTKRRSLLLLLALGSAIFMGIQFLVLHGFCLYCTLHAVAAWGALAVAGKRPHRLALGAGLVLALGGFAATKAVAVNRIDAAVAATPAQSHSLALEAGALPWLAAVGPESPSLLLSLNCPACIELMDQLTRTSYSEVTRGPALYFKTSDENRDLTIAFLASILGSAQSKREAFLASTALLLSMRDHALSSPATAAAQFSAMTPAGRAHREQAARLLDQQQETLTAARLGDATPLLVPHQGRPKAFFSVDELFERQR